MCENCVRDPEKDMVIEKAPEKERVTEEVKEDSFIYDDRRWYHPYDKVTI